MFRDGFQIVCTTDVQDSIRWLLKMWENLCNAQFEGYNTDESHDVYYKNVSRKLAKRSTSQMFGSYGRCLRALYGGITKL